MLNNLYRQFLQKLSVGRVSSRRGARRANLRSAGIVEHLEPRCLLSGTALVYAGIGTETLSPNGHSSFSSASVNQMPTVTPGQVSHSSQGVYQGAGLVIIPTFDVTITSDPHAAQIEATINHVIAEYEAAFSDQITVNINFQEMTTGLGQSNFYYYTLPYATFYSQLSASSTTSNDATAIANLPNTSTDPVLGQTNIFIKAPNARALDHSFVGNPSDGTISLNTSICNLDRSVINPNSYDLAAVTAHEVDEILGLGSALNLSSATNVFPQDLFRYDQTGTRSFTTNTAAQAYLSLDGTTQLVQFNQSGSGDYGDWLGGTSTPRVQDAFATPGVSLDPGVEFVNLDVQGWHYANFASKLNVSNVTVNQGTSATFTIGLSQASTVAVTVNYATSDGTATTAASDYTSTSGTATIPAGSLTTTVTVPTFADSAKTSATFFLNLSNASNALIAGGTGDATVIKPSTPALSQTAFTAIGPGSIAGDSRSGGNVSGRITGIATDPTNANIIYIAAAGGGVWKTSDGGASWIPLTDNQPKLAMGAIALAPSNPSVIYAGTGEANNSLDSQMGLGILVSQNGGATWTLTGATPFNHETISKIVVDPADPARAWVAAAAYNSAAPGIYKTTDYGATWTLVYSTTSSYEQFSDIALDPLSAYGSRILYAAVGTFYGSANNGVYMSTNDGTTWSPAGNFPSGATDGRITVAIAPTNDNIIFASIENPTTGGLLAMEKSTDGGTTWNALTSTPNYMGTQGWYDQPLAVSPTDPNVVFAGGAYAYGGTTNPNGFIESTDGGVTWTEIGTMGVNGVGPHPDHHAIVFDANGKLLDANDGGIFRLDVADPTGFAWSDLNSNLNITQFTGIALDPTNPNIAYGGSQDNGTEKFTGSSMWQLVRGGDGGFVRVDPNNPNTIYHTFFYGSGFFERSDDGGVTWNGAGNGINATNPALPQDDDQAAFYPPYVIDPSNTSRLVLGTDRVYQTLDKGNSWTAISAPATGTWTTSAVITSIATVGNTIYAAAGGHIYVTTNDGVNWTETTPEGTTTGYSYEDITVNPATPTTAYAVTSGHVVMTTNGGANWSDISGSLPLIGIHAIRVDTRNNAIYVGTDNGVDVSLNNGLSWNSAGAGLPNVEVVGLDLNPTTNILGVATHGRGMWELGLAATANHAPVGTSTTVTTLENTAYTVKTADFGFTDPNDNPPNTLLAVDISTLPNAGTLADSKILVTAGQFVSATDISAGHLVFTPATNASGTGIEHFTFQVEDNGGTANGGVNLDPNAKVLTLNVTHVNQAPVGTSTSVTTLENAAYTLKTTNFGFTDPNDNPANTLLAVKISTLPNAGTLKDNGSVVTLGQFVSATDISGSLLTFTPVTYASGLGIEHFTFQVEDNGGTANGGVNLDPNAKTLTVNVTHVNQAPVGTSTTTTTLENTAYTVKATDFGFTDPNDNPANTLLAVKITTLPNAGTLKDNGNVVTTGQFVNATDISGGLLLFTPALNAVGVGIEHFTFQVEDNGGTANGGVNLDPNAKSLTFNVTNLNHAPVGTSTTTTTLENTPYTVKTADFGFTDPNDNPPNTLLAVKISTLPNAGTLKDNSTLVTAGQFVTATDISGGKLVFTPALNANGLGIEHFTFQVQDNGGTANGGVNTDPNPKTLTFNVTYVNQSPVGTSTTVTTLENTAYTVKTTDFGFTDPNDNPPDTLLAVKISTLPNAGTLKDNGSAVTTGQFVVATDISGGKLAFTPALNAIGVGIEHFTFQVEDNGGTANGGVNLDPTAKTFTLNVSGINHAPVGTSTTVTTLENTAYTVKTADFGFTDPNDSPANTLLAVKVSTLPNAGTLKDNGSAVTTGQFVSSTDISGGKLVFAPALNAIGTGIEHFTFQVEDNGGTANGGVNLDPNAKKLTVNVTHVNQAPVGTSTTVTTLENTAYTVKATDFGFADPNDIPANTLLAVKVSTLPNAGTLSDNGAAVTAGQFVAATDISGGKLIFTPARYANGLGIEHFTFQVEDNGGTANGGVNLDPNAKTLTVNVTHVNQAPVGASKTITVLENTPYTVQTTDFGFTDPNDNPANALLAVKITAPGSGAMLKDNGTVVTSGQFVSATDISGGKLLFIPASFAVGSTIEHFKFQVEDNGGTANGGANLDPSAKTLTFSVTHVNQAPVGTSNTVTGHVNSAYTVQTTDFGFTDPNDTPENLLLAVKISALPTAGTLTDNGVAVTANQFVSAADIASGKLVYTPTSTLTGLNLMCKFQVEDDGGTANGGVNLDLTPKILDINLF